MTKTLAIALLVALSSTSALAQNTARLAGEPRASSTAERRGGFPVPAGRRSLIGLSGAPAHDPARHRGYGRNSFFYGGLPYFPPEYEDSYASEVVAQAPAPQLAPAAPARQEPVPSGVLLELQGNKWVRVLSFEPAIANNGAGQTSSSSSPVAAATRELPPAVIVYRDGRSEELSSYSIIGTTIYAKADYLTTGAWTRKIQLADLNLAATLKQNRDRGLNFDLPSGPNEVILRP